MEDRLKQKIKKEEKISVIIGIAVCAVLCVLIIVSVVNRVIAVGHGNTETTIWLDAGTVGLLICLIVVFVKYILFVCLDSKKNNTENYEIIKIAVLQVKTKIRLLYGTWESSVLVENLETGERFLLKGCGDMKENKTYFMLRAKRSKLFAYEPCNADETVETGDKTGDEGVETG